MVTGKTVESLSDIWKASLDIESAGFFPILFYDEASALVEKLPGCCIHTKYSAKLEGVSDCKMERAGSEFH